MATINGGDGGNVLVGTDADDVIYGHSVADTLPNAGEIVASRNGGLVTARALPGRAVEVTLRLSR